MITSDKNDNLESLMEKIKSGKDLNEKFVIYSLFFVTQPHYIKVINMSLQIWEPELWKIVRKAYYPNLWQRVINKLKINKK